MCLSLRRGLLLQQGTLSIAYLPKMPSIIILKTLGKGLNQQLDHVINFHKQLYLTFETFIRVIASIRSFNETSRVDKIKAQYISNILDKMHKRHLR